MMDDLDLVRRHRPRSEPPSPIARATAREQLVETFASSKSVIRSRPRRRLVWVGVALAAMSAGAAAWAVLSQPEHGAAFSCEAPGVTAVLPNDGTPPIDACARLWERGEMVEGTRERPDLVACVTQRAAISVVRRGDVGSCEEAGMATWREEGVYLAVGRAVRDARIFFHDQAEEVGGGCVTAGQWKERLRHELATQEAGEWRLETNQIEPGRRCYDVAEINPVARTILIIGVPGAGIGCDPRTGC